MTNELATASSAPLQTRERYVSPLEKIETYAELWQAGEMFAGSQLVPDSFRGKPGDCAIALDLALRLNLNPLSLFPQLFVIHGRPSLSAQYMIALVNRSGRFSAIRWEEGEDGVVEYDAYGKTRKAPNYYAVAYFTERATGDVLRSTRVDVRVAMANGWFQKDGSKWKTMPQQMCRYRSASWLIKSYAPELAMGLSFADEAEDVDASAPVSVSQPVVVQTPTVERVAAPSASLEAVPDADDDEPDASAFDAEAATERYLSDIQGATTLDELANVGKGVTEEGFTPQQLDQLRKAYVAKRDALKQGAPANPAPEAPKKTTRARSKKAESVEAQKPLESERVAPTVERRVEPTPPATDPAFAKKLEDELAASIGAAKTSGELLELVNRALDLKFSGQIDATAHLAIQARKKEEGFQGRFFLDEQSDEGTVFERNIREAMELNAENGDVAAMRNQARSVEALFVQGKLSSAQRDKLWATFNKLSNGERK